jgi:hypothetical protein
LAQQSVFDSLPPVLKWDEKSLCYIGEQGCSKVHDLEKCETKLPNTQLVGVFGPRRSVKACNIVGVTGPNDGSVAGCVDFLVK